MAFVRLMCKAADLDKRKLELDQEKQFAVQKAKSETQKKKKSLKLRYRHCWLDCLRRLRKTFRRCFTFPKKSRIFRCCYKMRHEGSCENYTLKSVVGFIGGFLITYVFFMFFVFQLNFKFSTATIMCSIFGSILTIGLAFSYKVRCVVFLTLPQLFSKRGRQALLAYAFILAITGPAKNTLNNMGILSESLACGQEQLKAAVKQILEVIKKPFYAIRDAIKAVVKVVKIVVKKIKEILLAIKRVIMAIVAVIKSVFEFLAKIINICNKELGTPFQRCTRVFESAITDCHAKLGPVFSWLCSITYIAQSVCYIVKIFDYVCMLVDFISNSVIGVIVKKIRIFIRHIKTMFYVRIKFSHSYHFETNASKSLEDVATGIVTEIKERTEGLMKVFDFMSCATSLFFMFIIFRVLYYRYKFLTDERFDNRFITKDFRAIDMKRAQLGKETVLPLNQRERNMYVSVGSCRLVKKEKLQLSQSAMVLGTASLKLATHMMADYALFWVLLQIRRHGSFQSSFTGSNIPTLHVKGEGLLADLLRSIVKAFQPVGLNLEIDTIPCLPDPIPPDYDRYVQIASLLVICWFLMLFEPFGLRWRQSVMCFYHPHRAKERSIWLYNHILRTRSSFLKFARRQLRRKFKGDPNIAKITCKEFVKANLLRYRVCRLCLSQDKQMYCLLCGEVFREGDAVKPIRCQTPNCPGIYCEKCFQDLQNLCTVCLDPIQYGDLSDISEEKDSSDLEAGKTVPNGKDETMKGRKKKKAKLFHLCRKRRPPSEDETDDSDTERLLGTESPTTLSTPPTSDSDYYSTDTELSYLYQYKKDITQKAVEHPRRVFVDIEKQRLPDYAAMDTFRESSPEKAVSSESEPSEPPLPPNEKFDIPLLDLRSIIDTTSSSEALNEDEKKTARIQAGKPAAIDGGDQPKPPKRRYLCKRKFWRKKKKGAEKSEEKSLIKDLSTSTETFSTDEGTEPLLRSSEETTATTSPSPQALTKPQKSIPKVPVTTKIPFLKRLKTKFSKKPLKKEEVLKKTTTKTPKKIKGPLPKEAISTETTTTTETSTTEEEEEAEEVKYDSKKKPEFEEETAIITPLDEDNGNKGISKKSLSEEGVLKKTIASSVKESKEIRKLLSNEEISEVTTTTTTTTETPSTDDPEAKGATKRTLPKTFEETTTIETPITEKDNRKVTRRTAHFDESELDVKPSDRKSFVRKKEKSTEFPSRSSLKAPDRKRKDFTVTKVSESTQTEETLSDTSPERPTKSEDAKFTTKTSPPADVKKERAHGVATIRKTESKPKSLRQSEKDDLFADLPKEDKEEILRKKKRKDKHRKKSKEETQAQTHRKPDLKHVSDFCAEILHRYAEMQERKQAAEIYCMNETCPAKLKHGKVPKLDLSLSPRERSRVRHPSTSSTTSFASSSTESHTSSVASKTSLDVPMKKRDKKKKGKENKQKKVRTFHRELSELDLGNVSQTQRPKRRRYDVFFSTESERTPRSNKESAQSVTFSPIPKRARADVTSSDVTPSTTCSSNSSVTILTSPNSQTVESQSLTSRESPHYTVNYLYSDDLKESDTTRTDVNENSYKTKARNYYRKLKTKPIENLPAPGDHRSKFCKFMHRLLRKN